MSAPLDSPAAIHGALYNHLVLPAKLPQHRDLDQQIPLVEKTLCRRMAVAARIMSALPDNTNTCRETWETVRQTVVACQRLYQGGRIDKVSLLRELQQLGPSGFIVLHIETQNAGLIIRRTQDPVFNDSVVFEAFEASAKNESVLAAKGALIWDFPGIAVAIPYTTFNDQDFQLGLANFIEQASLETVKDFAAYAFKAGTTVFEYRNTGDPSIISSLLMAILEENGRRVAPVLLRKRVRDDVCWNRAKKPWRRLPYYLVLRVAIQRYLTIALDHEQGRSEYKFFISVLLATFLDDSPTHHIGMEQTHFLKKKICRRLVKLDLDKDRCRDQDAVARYNHLFNSLGPKFDKSISRCSVLLEHALKQERLALVKHIPVLPRKACEQDLILSLRVSNGYIKNAIQSFRFPKNKRYQLLPNEGPAEAAKDHLSQYARNYHKLIDKEMKLIASVPKTCSEVSRQIFDYVQTALPMYEDNPEQKSLMLLTVMELWKKMDSIACESFPLLSEFHPVFHPQMLDVLLFPQFSDMARLASLQTFLSYRITRADTVQRNIFEDPSAGCFAERYYRESPDAPSLKFIHDSIVTFANEMRERKEAEWKRKTREYDELISRIDTSTCMYIVDEDNIHGRERHDPNCHRCSMMWNAQSMRISIFEEPLPVDPIVARSIVFELACPQEFAIYRDTTWWLLRHLATHFNDEGANPRCFLRDYVQLKTFSKQSHGKVGLASTTKPFQTTHYISVPFPVEWDGGRDGVCRPNALKLGYFDERTSTWPGRTRFRPSFAHHTALVLPNNSPWKKVLETKACALDGPGPSSYEIMASQSSCPAGINNHEYLAMQTLMTGKKQRWIVLLAELGSTNLNFSSEVTLLVVSHLALQSGPRDEKGDVLRTIHNVFRDDHFCDRFVDQLCARLESLQANWRETYLMDVVITLLLRTHALTATNRDVSSKAFEAILRARKICVRWVEMLRAETFKASDVEMSRRCQQYALWAAILCKRTFVIHANQSAHLDDTALQAYIECCITLQDNLVVEVGALPQVLRHAVISDMKLSYRLSSLVRKSIVSSSDTFRKAIMAVWPEADGRSRQISALRADKDAWVVCESHGHDGWNASIQVVQYNCSTGLLLVDSRPLGKLPKPPEHTAVLSELFGDQALLTRPSDMPGMDYTLTVKPKGYRIDVGYDSGSIVIRAIKGQQWLQFIQRNVFRSETSWDFPGPLLDGCLHWLDLRTGKVFISYAADIWNISHRNWTINTHQRTCSRPGNFGNDRIVDTYSPLFNRVARIFQGFETRPNLLVFQPPSRHLQVEIKRLQLLFHVNQRQLLESPQLGSEIDLDQDVGTWYGLESKLVFRNPRDPQQRSILVPMGPLETKRERDNLVVRITPNGDYAKFVINKHLGRIESTPEQLLLYMKAQLHAYTSSIFPDPLTGRTGTEEALQWLSSGACQPWSPLRVGSTKVLARIAQLTPSHEYYPADLKVMKTDHWTENLTESVQHERFRPLVEQIMAISAELQTFALLDVDSGLLPPAGDLHLHDRARLRRQISERSFDNKAEQPASIDQKYLARDCVKPANTRHSQVLEIVHMLRTWPKNLTTTSSLAQKLAQSNLIGGKADVFDKVSLNDRLSLDIAPSWGPLVRSCQEQQSVFALMFMLAPISYGSKSDVELVRTLASFSILEELKAIELPPWAEYDNFQPNQVPKIDYLAKMIAPFKIPAPKHDGDEIQMFASAKQLRRMREEKAAWEQRADADCKYLTDFFLLQWPCVEPGVSELSKSLLVDVQGATSAIRPEWKRLYQNMDLSMHLDAVQAVLNRHQSDSKYEPPYFIPSDEVFQQRLRGGEVPSLRFDLLKKSFDAIDTGTATQLQPASATAPAPAAAKAGPSSAISRHPAHIHQPIKLPYSQTRSSGTNVLAPSWMSSKTALVPSNAAAAELKQIVSELANSKSMVRQKYGEDLQRSLEAFVARKTPKGPSRNHSPAFVAREISLSMLSIDRRFQTIQRGLEMADEQISARRVRLLKAGQLWPAVTTVTLLEQLRSTETSVLFGKCVREHLIDFGLAITSTQRDLRINHAVMRGDAGRYLEEMANQGHSNWNPSVHPDWLLLEIEANLMIRPDQVDVALATISPASGANSVLQMNMGQGKTSCIIPMVAASLANRQNLVRVVVPKALLLQTAELLQARLGGLLDRQVRHIPFSRRTPTQENVIRAYHRVHRTMMKQAGVMVCQPEHNLSFMLSGLQRLLDDRMPEAGPMINVQSWLRSRCRDILDESDYTLAVRTQLIYPSGSQMTVDGHPHRWQVAQGLLVLIDHHCHNLAYMFPHSIEVVRRPSGGFPLLFFLRSDVEEELVRRLTADILGGEKGILPMQNLEPAERLAVRDFLVNERPRDATLQRIRHLCPDRPSVRQTVYLLRGVLVNRILMMTLKKRWNVQYGLHPLRDPIAVPYHAKGVPSEQSEWGHPDVAILFTCLAFYYDGISVAQLTQSLEHLFKSDDPSSEYESWARTSQDFPESLRAWNSINVDDSLQLAEIWKSLRYNVMAIDYFMNNFVFPQHAKQFKIKLQSNGWDIPLFSVGGDDQSAGSKGGGQVPGSSGCSSSPALTTGFSGTNDNRTMLPLTIKQEDLSGLSHTNAEVLTYLLHERSRECHKIVGFRGARASESDLLHELKRRDIKILIDAGAQILEMDNEALVRQWLIVDHSAPAAVFFDKGNKPIVIQRMGRKTPLLASPFADDLSKCLVYLDEAHTRGTDLKFPPTARGALTLGLGQSKDHTVQAAMRLRQLGTTQSVTFFAPPEVYQSIIDLQMKPLGAQVDSRDVISWLLDNTCEGIEQLQPLYYSQGIDFCRRMQAAIDNPDFIKDSYQRDNFIATVKQDEQYSLQQLYEPKRKIKGTGELRSGSDSKIRAFIKELNTRRKAFQDNGRAVHASALQEVEQEREVAFEVETVRQVKRPHHYPALSFPGLHAELESFARTGRMPASAVNFIPATKSISKTAIGKKFKVSDKSSQNKLFVSGEFERTIKLSFDLTSDNFLRNVNWILWSPVTEIALVIVPEEAEVLLSTMRNRFYTVATNLIVYSAPVTRKMLHFSDLNFYSIPALPSEWRAPAWLKIELGLYAGRLYFEWPEYDQLCDFLGIDQSLPMLEYLEESSDSDSADVQNHKETKSTSIGLTARPLSFVQEWLAARRRGQDFVSTPMGFIAQGKVLQESHPFFRQAKTAKCDLLFAPTHNTANDQANEDEYAVADYGVDDMGANEEADSDAHEDEIEYNDSEYDDSEYDNSDTNNLSEEE
ncbi:Putative P-loop containing nucleoside triphosphate hydrolase [Colletotrichum destructivum]|uniref:ubiquitinyl hydrolase 1 n=1 Tax=Colletotrichum destructivum TaxID=34406 RepID=A0AAX4J150_9PEZI|nr:Putative P-loop containing nucleoside triphosphate hydrolase [Colletotrichum destructivum]